MSAKVFLIATVVIASIAVIVGLATIGGPSTRRHVGFDEQRFHDIKRIAASLSCGNKRMPDAVLPAALSIENLRAHCQAVRFEEGDIADPETGVPYRYLRKNDREFSVCARFHDFSAMAALPNAPRDVRTPPKGFDMETGCLSGRLRQR